MARRMKIANNSLSLAEMVGATIDNHGSIDQSVTIDSNDLYNFNNSVDNSIDNSVHNTTNHNSVHNTNNYRMFVFYTISRVANFDR